MSVGSGFDARVKIALEIDITGKSDETDRELFEKQVERPNWEFAWEASQTVFYAYRKSGAYRCLLKELEKAASIPRFEFIVEEDIKYEDNSVRFHGRPDLYFVSSEDAHVIVDWKVNGFCSKYGVKPKAGYLKLFPGNKMHRDCHPMVVNGIEINVAKPFEKVDKSWASQLAIYGWCMGEPVGAPVIVIIEQLACTPQGIKCASHRGRVSTDFQTQLYYKAVNMMNIIHTGHIFDDLDYEESFAKQMELDMRYKAFEGDSDNDKWFREICGR